MDEFELEQHLRRIAKGVEPPAVVGSWERKRPDAPQRRLHWFPLQPRQSLAMAVAITGAVTVGLAAVAYRAQSGGSTTGGSGASRPTAPALTSNSFTAPVPSGSPQVTPSSAAHNSAAATFTPGKTAVKAPSQSTPPAASTVLAGDQTVEANGDSDSSGWSEAFQVTASSSGAVNSIGVYLDAGNTATSMYAGIYSDAGGQPGSLIASGKVTSISASAWNRVTMTAPNGNVTAGKTYWIAILGQGGTLNFRDHRYGGGTSVLETQRTLTSLPATWSSSTVYHDCPLSAFATG